ncbi:hypothetical protein BGZ61DRAFT_511634 [Ilyonectria robusta]|uniref:uncharacterized protein n=1 Tax=Ilyonectria robusta TaxID=1079257 RepID=UPI001E8D662B|nr:uncharacterized protein BGZ61DRAFT_511634 [Ilyonectria robusta]KAH8736930.1 hypothetical protein BGZ61DRAFT_511634 [Ilyonectria robusta]
MHVDVVPRRDDTACDDKQYFWVCHSGKFRGCCTEDPCGLGYCLDDDREKWLSTKRAASASSAKSRTASSTLTSSNDDDEGSTTETETKTETEERPTKTMTDSGTTHTIPNNDRVTVTKHTLIVTDKAPSRTPTPTVPSSSVLDSTGVPSSGATSVVPSETASAIGGSLENSAGSSFSTGAIAGAAIGGFIALAIIAILAVVFHRRRRHARRYSQDSMNNIAENGSGEKAYFEAMSPHTTGTQGSSDPFAPFGGRADKADDAHQPPSHTFEMDGTSSAPVELPAEIHGAADSRFQSATHSLDTTIRKHRVQPSGPTDPRANLNASTADRRHNTYVNHWNQYRGLGPER